MAAELAAGSFSGSGAIEMRIRSSDEDSGADYGNLLVGLLTIRSWLLAVVSFVTLIA